MPLSWRRGPGGLSVSLAADPVFAHNYRYNNLHGIVSVLAANSIMPFLGIFAIRNGASNFELGLLSSLPAVIGLVAMLPGARLVDRFPRKKTATLAFLLANRMCFVAIAMLPTVPVEVRTVLLVALVGLMNLPGAIGNVAWQSLIAGVVPPRLRGSVFATRQRLMSLAGMGAVLIAGRVIDSLPYPLGYQAVFWAAFILGLVEIGVLARLIEPEEAAGLATPSRSEPAPLSLLAQARLAGPFIAFTLAAVFFNFAWQMAWPLFVRYQVTFLGANNTWVSLFNLSNTLAAIVSYQWWARLADSRGNRLGLAAGVIGLSCVPTLYTLASNLPTLLGFTVFTGIFAAGTVLLLFNSMLEVVPDRNRTTFIALYSTAVSLVAAVAPLAGVWLFESFGIELAFFVSAALRFGAGLVIYATASRQATPGGGAAEAPA